jgi:phage baseplate assembly protein W
MAVSIKFQQSQKEEYRYSDLSLDLQKQRIPYGDSNLTRSGGSSDIKTDFDENAIANSLRNLFSTRPKQRLLDPEYGLDITQFLFENANEFSARLIARRIDQGIRKYEPRVVINNITVIVEEEFNRYNISINLRIPTLSKDVIYQSIISESGFTI